MGASLARVVAGATWGRLPLSARMVAVHMAVTALDHDKPPRYFGGRDALVLALNGYLADDPVERDQQYKRLQRALKQLRAAGLIEPLNNPRAGQRAEYALHVLGGHSATPSGGQRTTPCRAIRGSPSDR